MSESAPIQQDVESLMVEQTSNSTIPRSGKGQKSPPDIGPENFPTQRSKYHKAISQNRKRPTKYLCSKYCYPILKKVCKTILSRQINSQKGNECIRQIDSILKYIEKKSILAKFYTYLVKIDKRVFKGFLQIFQAEIKSKIKQLEKSSLDKEKFVYLRFVLNSIVRQIKKVKSEKGDWKLELWRLTQRIERSKLKSFVVRKRLSKKSIQKIKLSVGYCEFIQEIDAQEQEAEQWSLSCR